MEVFDFLNNYAPALASLAGAAYLAIEILFFTRTPWRERRMRSLLLFGFILVAAGGSLFSVYVNWAPKDAWQHWKTGLAATLNRCIDQAEHLQDAKLLDETKILREGGKLPELVKFQCLTLAMKHNPRPATPIRVHSEGTTTEGVASQISSLDRYITDQYAGAVLYTIPEVGPILREPLGLYSDLFLGTGFSYPRTRVKETGGIAQYRAGVREYLIPNYCVGQIQADCAEGYQLNRRLWVWALDRSFLDVAAGTRIRDIITNIDPQTAVFGPFGRGGDKINRVNDNFASKLEYIKSIATSEAVGSEQVLIRISQFNYNWYKNTVGPPGRAMVFFANLRDLWNASLEEARVLTGRINRRSNPDEMVFIWVHILDTSASDGGNFASWTYIFELLRARAADADQKLSAAVAGLEQTGFLNRLIWTFGGEARRSAMTVRFAGGA